MLPPRLAGAARWFSSPSDLSRHLSRSIWFVSSPASSSLTGAQPTAFAWLAGELRERVSRSALITASRKRLIRCLHDDRMRRVSGASPLPSGARVAIRWADLGCKEPVAARTSRPCSDALVAELSRRVLYRCSAWAVLDKPAGVPTQGGDGIEESLDRALPRVFSQDRQSEANFPKLVHRLDAGTAGCILVAFGRGSAAAFTNALRRQTQEALAAGEAGDVFSRGPGGEVLCTEGDMRLRKTYHALVDNWTQPATISSTGLVRTGNEGAGAVTAYEVLAVSGGRALLRLAPLTGRKRQLREHCASVLGAPIVGDPIPWSGARRGSDGRTRLRGSAAGDAVRRKGFDADLHADLHLHSRELVVATPAGAVRVVSPTPPHMRWTLEELGMGQHVQRTRFVVEFPP